MARSLKKGPYIDHNIKEKLAAGKKKIKTYSRATTISPEMVGVLFHVHNGRSFVDVFVSEHMVSHKLGEFAPTRTFTGHTQKK